MDVHRLLGNGELDTVDYYQQPKASYHYMKRAYNPISVIFSNTTPQAEVWVINDTLDEWVGKVSYGISSFDGSHSNLRSKDATVPANSRSRVATLSELESQSDLTGYFGHATLRSSDGLLSQNRTFFCSYKDLQLPKASITCREVENGRYLELSSDHFAWMVTLEDENGRMNSLENAFDLFPGSKRLIPLDLEMIGRELIIKAINPG